MTNSPMDATDATVNIGTLLTDTARQMPEAVAVAMPVGRRASGKRKYCQFTFRQLHEDSARLACGLQTMGITPGKRLVLMVRPSIDFISLAFALFKAGAVTVLIDPGMGRKNLLSCLDQVDPAGFVAIPVVHAVRVLTGRRYAKARYNVTVGRRWFWGGPTVRQLRSGSIGDFRPAPTLADDPAAIIFTTGSTGPPKGVLYSHGNFARQVTEIRDFYGIQSGEIDLPGFPLFALFNCAMGVTTVIPAMDPRRPAQVDPRRFVEAIQDWSVTQAFGSPAIWNVVGRYCQTRGVKLPSLKRVLSAGAPVPPDVLRRMKSAIHHEGDIHTPYGATEALPVASISATEVLAETAAESDQGAGTCVGSRFPGIRWKVVRARDAPIRNINQIEELPCGEIGELIVSGPVVTREYVTRIETNELAKIADGKSVWHRMGDVGYLDEAERFWFCGRQAHRVLTAEGPMYTIPCEAIFNRHDRVYRSALVGVGPSGRHRPVVVVEPMPGQMPRSGKDRRQFLGQLHELAVTSELTRRIEDFLIHPSLPVDIRHNVKIFREKLAIWAAQQLGQ